VREIAALTLMGIVTGLCLASTPASCGCFFLMAFFLRKCFENGSLFGVAKASFGFSVGYLMGSSFWLVLAVYRPPANDFLQASSIIAFVFLVHALIHATLITFSVLTFRFLGLRGLLGTAASVSLGWSAAEAVRSVGFWAMPWGAIGLGQVDNPIFRGFYPVCGVLGVSALTWLFSGAMAGFYNSNALRFDTLSQSRAMLKQASLACWATILCIGFASFVLDRIEWNTSYRSPLRVRIVHSNWIGEVKHLEQVQKFALNQILLYANDRDTELTLFPELHLVAPPEEIEPEIRRQIIQALLENKTSVMFGEPGTLLSDGGQSSSQNNIVLLDSNAKTKIFSKQILVPYSEYAPTVPIMEVFTKFFYRYPMRNLVAGDANQLPLTVAGLQLGLTICNELAYHSVNAERASAANLLVNASNDSWVQSSFYFQQMLNMARVRSLETRLPMIRANNSGLSAFIDYRGAVQSAIGGDLATGILDVQPRLGNTPFTNIGGQISRLIYGGSNSKDAGM
jgi:apolipoprotein N-acyltransferase